MEYCLGESSMRRITVMAPQKSSKKPKLTPMAKAKAASVAHKPEPGLLVTKELDKAIADCKAEVERISKSCRLKNQKFRDIEFDLENDTDRCLHGLYPDDQDPPPDVQRVTQIFKQPKFFAGGTASPDDIIQGSLGDCWFLSALATISTCPGLVEKFCVARDEQIGVYGFIFFRDTSWVTVIVDDLLFTRSPKWEELTDAERGLYHENKDLYNKSSRKGGMSLQFARSGRGETWVPLIEKAYAKLHGNYQYLNEGEECEAIEDLTGGVSTMIQSKDILDIDRFWREELTRANTDRLFGCSLDEVINHRNPQKDLKVRVQGLIGNHSYSDHRNPQKDLKVRVQGLIGNHSYSVLRAIECNGKRFVVVRNPWGKSEWTGRWSDGSKEWTQEWLQYLPTLGHQFGDDGQFVMEYTDWLEAFSQIDRTIFFDNTWTMSSNWFEVTSPPLPSAWSYGEISFKFTLAGQTKAVIVLSKLDDRYYHDLCGRATWTVEFSLVREGEKTPIASSNHSYLFSRSVNLEATLEAGTYLVYVRLDRQLSKYWSPNEDMVVDDVLRKLSRIMTERAKSRSIVTNFNFQLHQPYIPLTLEEAIDLDHEVYDNGGVKQAEQGQQADEENPVDGEQKDDDPATIDSEDYHDNGSPQLEGVGTFVLSAPDTKGLVVVPKESHNVVVVGLKVYTNKDVDCSVEGRLRTGP